MSDILNNIMTFINENTYILIGICIFLILVLIGYLIDNNLKSKKVQKNLVNKPKIETSEKNKTTKEIIVEDKKEFHENIMDNIQEQTNNSSVFEPSTTSDLTDLNMKLNSDQIVESSDSDVTGDSLFVDNSDPLTLNLDSNNDSKLAFNIDTNENILEDPDNYILENVQSSEYKNDRKLSDILSDVGRFSKEQEKATNDIFDSNVQEIVINPDVQKEKVEIEPTSSNESDELDKIMAKLSSMNKEDEDNYTNIF